MGTSEYRLPNDVVPSAYLVTLDVSPRRTTFSGRVQIEATATKPAREITFNARDLKILDFKVQQGRRRCRVEIATNPKTETLTLKLNGPLTPGPLKITVSFRGKLSPGMHGLYRAKFGNEVAIVSQCEAADARAIFPCWDEPSFKATIEWSILTDTGLEVITNGLFKSRKALGDNLKKTLHRFKPTRKISTYLAAVTIGKYDFSLKETINSTICRIGCGKGKLDQTQFAACVTRQVFPWYEDYFSHPYHYQKLDQIAVPGFDAGAMENVGAIFYRQNLLLMDEATTSWSTQKRIAEVIAHEIAHQWFGNLVTMEWWDDLWLNEAFATWIAYKAIHAWRPQWRMWDDYRETKEGALRADALVNTHPIYTSVRSPSEATELFDIITYEKGCAVLLMAENYLGGDTFRAGIQEYIQKFRESNATGSDLWESLARTSSEPVDRLMRSWVTQSGFPLITIKRNRRNGKNYLKLRQKRFFSDRGEIEKDNAQIWLVPMVLRFGTKSGTHTARILLDRDEQEIELPTSEPITWIYPNGNSTGFYRMQFDASSLKALLKRGLPHLTPAARTSIIHDQWALVKSGLATLQDFMETLTAFHNDYDHMVVRAVVERLQYLSNNLVTDNCRPHLQRFTSWLFQDQFTQLTWASQTNEAPEAAVRRAAIIGALGDIAEDSEILKSATLLAKQERTAPASVEPNLAGIAIRLAAKTGNSRFLKEATQTYLERQKNGASPELQLRYLMALSAVEKPTQIKKVLSYCLNGTIPQDQLRSILIPMLAHRKSQLIAWDFLRKYWNSLAPKIGSMGIVRVVEATGALPGSQKSNVRRFFTQHPVEEAKRALQKAIEAIELRAELEKRETKGLSRWLEDNISIHET